MLVEKYMELIINEYFKDKKDLTFIELNRFVKETGLNRMDVVQYFNVNNYKETIIGNFMRKGYL